MAKKDWKDWEEQLRDHRTAIIQIKGKYYIQLPKIGVRTLQWWIKKLTRP